ncbi:MAG: hypothetical protein KAJ75_09115 [Alphaproteobacteria bacterium]|nr:hypothetical protein [Alphaproteobacteria bacterium]
MSKVKKEAEANQAINNFAKKGKVKAFMCGAAKMLEEEIKYKVESGAIKEKIAVVVAVVALSPVLPPILAIEGTRALFKALEETHINKALLKKLVSTPKNIKNSVKKDINNFANKAIEKGGR